MRIDPLWGCHKFIKFWSNVDAEHPGLHFVRLMYRHRPAVQAAIARAVMAASEPLANAASAAERPEPER